MDKQKSIFIVSFFIVLVSSFFIYSQRKNIEIIDDVIAPVQNVKDRRCFNFDKVTSLFKKYASEDPSLSQVINSSDVIIVKNSENKAYLSFPIIKNQANELNESQISEILIDFQKNIEPEIKKLGLIKEYTYSKFNNLDYQFRQEGSIYTISIPTNSESVIILDRLEIKCGEVNQDTLKTYSLIMDNYSKTNILNFLQNVDNVLILAVADINYGGGHTEMYHMKAKPELIYSGQESVNCSILKERNIGKGLECISEGKYILNE